MDTPIYKNSLADFIDMTPPLDDGRSNLPREVQSAFEDHIKKLVDAENAKINKVLMDSIASGKYGVTIVRDHLGMLRSIEVDKSVPYLHVDTWVDHSIIADMPFSKEVPRLTVNEP